MGSRYPLKTIESNSISIVRESELVRDSLANCLQSLDTIIPPVAYPKGAVLFMEGETSCGIFAVCSGQVKLFTSSREGNAIILKLAGAGELLGLPATLSGKPYEVTAEVLEQARVNFIPRAAFLSFLRAKPEAIVQVTQLLTNNHFSGHEVIQSFGRSRSGAAKLARFFLGWSCNYAHDQDRLRIALTHEEIGQMIGVRRETVTRLLTSFKKRRLLAVKGSAVNICDRPALQHLAGR